MNYCIYTLSHPITQEVKYIGKTNDIIKTFSRHICDKRKTYKVNWINKLKLQKLKPIIEVLDITENQAKAYFLEQYWISQFKCWGFTLTNLTDGGNGNFGKKLSPIEKATISKVLKDKYAKEPHPLIGSKHTASRRSHLSKVSHLHKLKHLPNVRRKKVLVYKGDTFIEELESLTAFCKKYKVNYTCASKVVTGKRNNTKGYILKYLPPSQDPQ